MSINFLPAQKITTVSSPDGNLKYTFSLSKTGPEYSVSYKKQILIEHSSISLLFEGNDAFKKDIQQGKSELTTGTDDYHLPQGKTSYVHDTFSEAAIPLQERGGKKRMIVIRVKVFNDGLGFRYEFPEQANWKNYVLTEENTNFNLKGNPTARYALLPNFVSSHEHRYNLQPLSEVKNDTLIETPALFEFPSKIYMAITEANLVNYAGMSLIKKDGMLTSQLSPLPGQSEIKVKATLPHHSPWRVLMISDRIGALIETNILTSLSEPSKIQDFSWLKPGKATFHWWNGDVLPDTTFEAGVNDNFNKYYIDFCARNGIEYHTIIGNRGVAWYVNDGLEYQPGPNTDITKPRLGLDVQALCDYAKTKGVGIRFWVHWQALYPKLDSAFTVFEKWGIKGMMVDFMDRDDQQMVNIQEEILQKAAQHHLEIQFHGAFKPTGLSRTYPNESTREGTLNYENDKWGNLITPDDDIQIPFTRLLAGPTDYHLGGFNAMPAATFKSQVSKPHVLGTRCHMLAMYVVLENHVSMVCDYPQAYEGQAGFDFLQKVPTIWDETKVPGAETGQWVGIARRKGDEWYLGVINNNTERTVSIPLTFLSAGTYHADVYKETPDAVTNPNSLIKESLDLNSAYKLTINLPPGGGEVIRFHK